MFAVNGITNKLKALVPDILTDMYSFWSILGSSMVNYHRLPCSTGFHSRCLHVLFKYVMFSSSRPRDLSMHFQIVIFVS